ncbi:MAG: hypothetical protein KGJ88_03920 [Verrucomicrobiota bacterium]|nr:hypothetical protein [Verrucomicrobiota bacterium]
MRGVAIFLVLAAATLRLSAQQSITPGAPAQTMPSRQQNQQQNPPQFVGQPCFRPVGMLRAQTRQLQSAGGPVKPLRLTPVMARHAAICPVLVCSSGCMKSL